MSERHVSAILDSGILSQNIFSYFDSYGIEVND